MTASWQSAAWRGYFPSTTMTLIGGSAGWLRRNGGGARFNRRRNIFYVAS